MPIKNNFPREGRWDCVGLDCSECQYFKPPANWPDNNRTISCNFHKISLAIELGENGYKFGEWFCKNFQNNGKALKNAVREFERIKSSLDQDTLYMLTARGDDLKEVKFDQLK
ncbi:MAG: hypothetical protein AAB065_08515 [Deltaproteobacteria bacterium]